MPYIIFCSQKSQLKNSLSLSSFSFYNANMKLESVGIIIGLKPFGERDILARIFTRDHGVMMGMLRGGAVARKNIPMTGLYGNVSWNARLESQLGVFHFESLRNLSAPLMASPAALADMNSAFDLIATMLPERNADTELFDATMELLENLCPPPAAKLPTPPQGGSNLLRTNYSPLEGESERLVRRSLGEGGSEGGGKDRSRQYTSLTLGRAQNLRRSLTEAERLLWYYLKNDKIGFAFRKQQPIGKYIVDFINFEKKIIIELDGGQHGEESAIKYDAERDDFLRDQGYVVLRFWNKEVFKDIKRILDVIYSACAQPHPDPSSLSLRRGRPALKGRVIPAEPYLKWQLAFLRALGYELDLRACGGCGARENLTHLSRRTGRAVCATCAAPYESQTFELPITPEITKFFITRAKEVMT